MQSDTRARMQRQTDPFLRDRLHDFDDLANRLLRELMGRPHGPLAGDLPEDAIIVARNMGAAELLDYDRERLRGLVLEEAGPTSHVAIVARALGIATVGPGRRRRVAGRDRRRRSSSTATTGEVHLRPPADVEAAYADKVRFRARKQEQYRLLRDEPSVTRDGDRHRRCTSMPACSMDLPHLEESGAAGIGLFRTELQFMIASSFPRLSEQQALLHGRCSTPANGKPVTFRSLDVGGDKVLPYLPPQKEENPAMGWRAIRLGLDRPALLRTQVRALLKAAAGRELRLMFPMVTEVDEFERAKALVERERAHLAPASATRPPSARLLGTMIEVPSLLWQLDELMRGGRFRLGRLQRPDAVHDGERPRQHAARRPLRSARRRRSCGRSARSPQRGETAGKPVTLCGEIAGRPLDAMALVGDRLPLAVDGVGRRSARSRR